MFSVLAYQNLIISYKNKAAYSRGWWDRHFRLNQSGCPDRQTDIASSHAASTTKNLKIRRHQSEKPMCVLYASAVLCHMPFSLKLLQFSARV